MSEDELNGDTETASESLLSSWVLEVRGRFAEREAVPLPAGIEGPDDLPRVVFLVALCVLEEKLCVVLSLEDDLGSEGEVPLARLPAREALVDGETGEDPAEEWFEPLAWDEPLSARGEDPGRQSDDDGAAAPETDGNDTPALDPVWGAATALVREHYTEEVQVALQVGELDDQFLVGRRCVGCVVALPRRVVADRQELEAVLALPLESLLDPDHIEGEPITVDGLEEVLHAHFHEGRKIPGPSVLILRGLLERLALVEEPPVDA